MAKRSRQEYECDCTDLPEEVPRKKQCCSQPPTPLSPSNEWHVYSNINAVLKEAHFYAKRQRATLQATNSLKHSS